jgi:hypothetical protein
LKHCSVRRALTVWPSSCCMKTLCYVRRC